MREIDDLIKKMALKAIEKQGAGFFAKLGFTIVLLLGLWYLRHLLDKKNAELAEAKTQAAWALIEANRQRVQAKLAENELVAKVALSKAELYEAEAATLTQQVKAGEAAYVERLARVDAVSDGDWEALNKLAGVSP